MSKLSAVCSLSEAEASNSLYFLQRMTIYNIENIRAERLDPQNPVEDHGMLVNLS